MSEDMDRKRLYHVSSIITNSGKYFDLGNGFQLLETLKKGWKQVFHNWYCSNDCKHIAFFYKSTGSLIFYNTQYVNKEWFMFMIFENVIKIISRRFFSVFVLKKKFRHTH